MFSTVTPISRLLLAVASINGLNTACMHGSQCMIAATQHICLTNIGPEHLISLTAQKYLFTLDNNIFSSFFLGGGGGGAVETKKQNKI